MHSRSPLLPRGPLPLPKGPPLLRPLGLPPLGGPLPPPSEPLLGDTPPPAGLEKGL